MVSLDCLMEQYLGTQDNQVKTKAISSSAVYRMYEIIGQLTRLHGLGYSIDSLLLEYTRVPLAQEKDYNTTYKRVMGNIGSQGDSLSQQ